MCDKKQAFLYASPDKLPDPEVIDNDFDDLDSEIGLGEALDKLGLKYEDIQPEQE